MTDTLVFERGDRVYIVGPVGPFEPSAKEIEEFAFAESLKAMAPNKNLVWMRGSYVEADRPNANGAMWTADELAIKSLTPQFMPVTVMHDPRTAVGLIADTALVTPEAHRAPRARIDTTLGLWGHRFPDVVEEALENYRQGSLMQSMECLKGYYDCGECGRRYPCLPGGAEKANWCAHLKGETAAANGRPVRRLGNVTFTGTGLIFGTRGARGAYDEAHLDVFQEEVAEFHERAHAETRRQRPRSKRKMEIEDKRYEELVAAEARVRDLEPKLTAAEEKAAKVPDLERQVEQLEVAKKGAEDSRDAEKQKREQLEETARAATLASERVGKLGAGFTGKLPESIRTRLSEQAKSLSDDEWAARLDELAELTGVKPDEGAPAGSGSDGEFSREEIARSSAGDRSNGDSKAPTAEARRSVVGGLVKSLS